MHAFFYVTNIAYSNIMHFKQYQNKYYDTSIKIIYTFHILETLAK